MDLPESVWFILDTLNQNRYEAFVVGGCVRDSLMGIEPKDYDIATSATPLQIKPLFEKTFDTGIKHGTITVVVDGVNFEVTTYRIDGEYKDGRRPVKVSFANKLIDDLIRRDFTINAIAYHGRTGYIDPYDGLDDIDDMCIRGVGDPAKRYQEDALRMLRCIRFASQLGFYIERETYQALIDNASLISQISIERVRDEIIKTFLGGDVEKSILLINTGIISHINIKLSNYLEEHLTESVPYIERANKDITDRFIILFRNATDAELLEFLKFLKFSNEQIKTITTLKKYVNVKLRNGLYSVRKVMAVLGLDMFLKLVSVKRALGDDMSKIIITKNKIIKNNDPISLRDLKIDGNVLKNNNICDGKQMGEVLNYLLDCVLRDPTRNTRETLLTLAEKSDILREIKID